MNRTSYPFLLLDVPAPAHWARRSGSVSGTCFAGGGFPLARPLPSIPSAPGCPALFGDFAGTTGLSDFPCPFIIGLCP